MGATKALIAYPASRWQVDQVVVLDWEDGPRNGIAALAFPNCEVAFDLLAERFNPDGVDDRLFRIRELPTGSCRSILRIISKFGEPSSPVWVPVWRFADDCEREKTDHAVRAILARGRKTPIVVLSQDMTRFAGVWSVHGEVCDQVDWFEVLGIG